MLINLEIILVLAFTLSLIELMLCLMTKTSISEIYDFRVICKDFKENIGLSICAYVLIIIFHILTPLLAICYWIYKLCTIRRR